MREKNESNRKFLIIGKCMSERWSLPKRIQLLTREAHNTLLMKEYNTRLYHENL